MRTLKSLVLLIIAAASAGVVYEQWGRSQDRKRFPQVGRSVDIGGRTLNIHCLGEGGLTVVLNSGGGGPGYDWAVIQPQIANFARACWWDRPGVGWSDPGPYPLTCRAMAKDLHDLLRAAELPPPYVMVGASFGGLVARVYNGLYPDEVAGMVLVDASHEEEYERIPDFGRARRAPGWLRYPIHLLSKMLVRVGVVRFASGKPRTPPAWPGWTPEQREILAHLGRRPVVLNAELLSEEPYREARESGGLGDKPLIVLTAGKPHPAPPGRQQEADAYQEVWKHELQPKLARLSTRGRQVIVDASHGMQFEAPEVVIGAVKEVLTDLRRERR